MHSEPNNIYSRALAEARSELVTLSLDIESLSKRKAQVEAVIANLAPLLPQSTPTLIFPPQNRTVAPEGLAPQPIWKSILQALNGRTEEFSVRDVLAALERIGRGVGSPNNFQIVRAVLKKKTDNFEQLTPGRFRIKDARTEKEVASKEGTS